MKRKDKLEKQFEEGRRCRRRRGGKSIRTHGAEEVSVRNVTCNSSTTLIYYII